MKEKKILIFGTGEYAHDILRLLEKKYNIIGYIDNNFYKQGTSFCGKEIYTPNMISELKYDYIYIASMQVIDITLQLNNEFNVSPEKIKYIKRKNKKSFFQKIKYFKCAIIIVVILLLIYVFIDIL